ncbi:MAG: TOBE-like domain-containing protein, partial [Propionicimonas sp.]|nr:TOBE domain-containing protein [Propionicimonas sp.]
SDQALVLESGRITEQGPTEQVLAHPRTGFTARIAGLNLVRGTAHPDGLRDPSGGLLQGIAGDGLQPGEPAVAVFAPSAVSIYLDAPLGSPRNLVPVTVAEVEPRGPVVRVRGDDGHGHLLGADITPRAAADLDLYPGRRVVYSLKATAVTLYPA